MRTLDHVGHRYRAIFAQLVGAVASLLIGATVLAASAQAQGAGTIIIEKEAVGGDGASAFAFTSDTNVANFFSITPPANGTGSITISEVSPGSYQVSEAVPAGWVLSSVECTDPTGDSGALGANAAQIDLAAGETVTCHFKNTRLGSIRVEKISVNGDGTTAFNFQGTNGIGSFMLTPPANGATSETFDPLQAGTYAISETAVAGWTTALSCFDPSGGTTTSGLTATVDLAPGENVICQFTNTRQIGTIIIEKEAVNGTGTTPFSFTGNGAIGTFQLTPPAAGTVSQTFANLSSGTFSVAETAVPGWTTSVSCTDPTGDSTASGTSAAINLGAGETVTCRFTNTRQNGTIVIEKEAINGNGTTLFSFTGSGAIGSFQLTPPAAGTVSQTFANLSPGAFSVAETAIPGWTTFVSCTDPSGNSTASGTSAAINVAAGETVICRFTNTHQIGTIIIEKEAVNGNGTQAFAFNGIGPISNFQLTPPANGVVSQTFADIRSGNYPIIEPGVTGWDNTSVTCSDPNNNSGAGVGFANVVLEPGETVTCRFVNTAQKGSVEIVKGANNTDGTVAFQFTGSFGNFSLTPTSIAAVSQTFTNIVPGTYSVSEIVPPGWTLSGGCNDAFNDSTFSGDTATIVVSPGEHVQCIFNNTRPPTGTITIEKEAVNGDGSTGFFFNTTSGTGSPFDSFVLTPPQNGVVSQTFPDLAPGSYTVFEAFTGGYTQTVSCTDPSGNTTFSGNSANISLSIGETVTCRFTNTGDPATIIIEKEAVNGDGTTAFDFTGDAPLGSFQLTPPANGVVTQTFSNVAAGSYAISEAPVSGWVSSVSCTDPSGNTSTTSTSAAISVTPGETVTCRFRNVTAGTPGSIVIVKRAVNGGGTTAFNFTAGGAPLSDFQLTPPANGDVSQTFSNVPPGGYTVSEAAVSGWNQSVSCDDPSSNTDIRGSDVEINVSAGETVTCTFVNERATGRARVIIEKEAVNGDGATGFQFTASNGTLTLPFTLVPPATGVVTRTFTIPSGAYTVNEAAVPGWTTTLSCTDPTNDTTTSGATATIDLSAGEDVTCRFINTKVADVPGTIIIEKEAVDGNGTTAFTFTADPPIGGFSLTPPANGTVSRTFSNISAGTYQVTEAILPGWTTDVSCSDPSNNSERFDTSGPGARIIVGSGETVTCRFTNAFTGGNGGSITIEKQAVAGNGTTPFNFTATLLGGGPVITFTLTPPANGTVSRTFVGLPQGDYTVAETAVPGFTTTIQCTDPTGNSGPASGTSDPTANVNLSNGEAIVCRFVNTPSETPGTIIIEKQAVGGNGSTAFAFDVSEEFGGAALASFALTPPANGTVSRTITEVPAGTYVATENFVTGFVTSVTCTDPTGNSAQIIETGGPPDPRARLRVGPGETVTCRFVNTNENTPGRIVVEKQAVNGDGATAFSFHLTSGTNPTNQTFTLTPPANGTVSRTISALPAGTYSLAEAPVDGWTTTAACTGPSGNSAIDGDGNPEINLGPGETVTCHYTNTRAPSGGGTIIVEKEGVNGDGTTAFEFTANVQGGPTLATFTLTPPANGVVSRTFSGLPPGIYVGTETAVPGWSTMLSCADPTGNTNINGRTATINLAGAETIICRYVNTRQAAVHGNLTIVKRTVGGDSTFSFTSSNANLAGFSLTTTAAQASRVATNIAIGTYVVTETPIAGWALSDVQCTGGASAIGEVTARTATINLANGESVTCTFTNTRTGDRTTTIINNFLKRRGDLLTNDDGGPRLIDRLHNPTPGGGVPIALGGDGDDSSGRIIFGTSLRKMLEASQPKDMSQRSALGMTDKASSAPSRYMPRYGLDVWIEGSYTYFANDDPKLNNSGHFGLVRVGADYLFSDTLLAGVLVQFDDMDENSRSAGYRVEGRGWMAGPYAEARLGENFFVDVKALWGQSDNDISPFMTYTDSFDTERWLLSARIKGYWTDGNWKFTPSAQIVAFSDTSADYIDRLGIAIPSQGVTIGRAIFGPEVSYRFMTENDWLIEPRLALKGIWTFSQDDGPTIGIAHDSIDPIRARIEGGVKIEGPDRTRLEFNGAYDGIGADDTHAVTGKAMITIPLQ